jgi:hypothetical protein
MAGALSRSKTLAISATVIVVIYRGIHFFTEAICLNGCYAFADAIMVEF